MGMNFIFLNTDDGQVYNEYLAVIIECIIYFSCGLHTGWTSPSIRKIQSEEYPFEITNEEASYIAILGPVGDLVGEMSIFIADKIGRKYTLLFAGLPLLLAWMLIYLSYISPIFLYVSRFLGGITMGIVLSVTPMYTSEISRPDIRGRLGVLSVLAFILGLISVNLIGKYLNIHNSALVFVAILVLFLSTFPFMPETPYFYLAKQKISEAESSLQFLRRKKDVTKELCSLSKDVERQLSESGTFWSLFSIGSNRKAVTLMIGARIFQQLTGATTLMMYGQHLLQESNDIMAPEISITMTTILQAACSPISGSLSDKFGRIPPMVYSLGICSGNLLVIAIYFTLKNSAILYLPSWILLVTFGIFFISFQLGIGSMLNILLGEMFSSSVKPKAICLVNVTYSLTVILATKFYQICYDYLDISIYFYICAVFTFVGMVFIKLRFIETKGKTLEQIQIELKGNKTNDRKKTRFH